MRISSFSLASLSGPRASLTRTAFSPRLGERFALRMARGGLGYARARAPLQNAQSRAAEDADEERSPCEQRHEARVSAFVSARAALARALDRALRRRARRDGRASARGAPEGDEHVRAAWGQRPNGVI